MRMKKKILIILAVVLFIGLVLAVMMFDWNRFNKENLYVIIEEPSEFIEDRLESGEIIERYGYDSIAVDEEGKEVAVMFEAHKILREGAYLKLYVNKEQVVTSYDEVSWEALPAKVQEKWSD